MVQYRMTAKTQSSVSLNLDLYLLGSHIGPCTHYTQDRIGKHFMLGILMKAFKIMANDTCNIHPN